MTRASKVVTFNVTSGSTQAAQLADWNKRSTMPSVVWAHNFATAAEVNQFRETSGVGIDPVGAGSDVTFQADGFGGAGCVQINIRTGATANGFWTRPFSAMQAGIPSGAGAGNGRSVNDPAASGTVSLNTWNSSGTNQAYVWRRGYYANPQVQSDFPFWPDSAHTGVYDGSEFWLQFRVKISGSRWAAGNPPGKLMLIDVTEGLSNLQELVIRSINNPDSISGAHFVNTNPFIAYTSRGSYANSGVGQVQGAYSGSLEPGGPFEASCTYGNTQTPGACWEFPADQWTTLLVHFVPGRDNANYTGNPPAGALATWPFHDTILEVWKCDAAETAYTKIFEKFDLAWFYYSDPQSSGPNGPTGGYHAPAFNSLEPSGYMNGVNAVSGWTQKFTELVFSHDWIPAPGQAAPAWWTALADSVWTSVAGSAGQRITDVLPSPVPNSGLSGEQPASITQAWAGASIDQRRGEYMMIANGGHADYPGNEGYALSLRDAVPKWRRISDPTPNARLTALTTTNGVLTYSDGRPRADHTSGWPSWGDGRVWFMAQSAATSGPGQASPGVYSYDRDALGAAATPMLHSDNGGTVNPWTTLGIPGGMENSGANGSFTFGYAVWDRVGHYVYGLSGFGYDRTTFWYWRVKTTGATRGTIDHSWVANNGNPFANCNWAVCAHDLRIIVMGDGSTNQRILVLDLNKVGQSGDWSTVAAVTGTGYFVRSGAAYVPQNNTIGIGDPVNIGARIYRLKIPTKTINGCKVYDPAGTWAWSSFVPAGTTPVAAGDVATYTKFNLVEDMGDGRQAFVFCGSITGATYIYKIPAAGL